MSGLWHDLTFRGLVAQGTGPELAGLLDHEQLVVYVGFDPTSDSLQLGNLMQVLLLRRLQDAGHRPIALAGGGTGLVGDPGGRSEERPLLSVEQLRANLEGIRSQLGRFLDMSEGRGKPGALLVDNGDWLWSLGLLEFLRDVGKHFGVGQMIAKDSVRTRLEGREQGISFAELSYMLLQAYDYLHLYDVHGCRLQAGASDQWGNITAGVELIRRVRRGEAHGLTTPLMLKPDGTKFGKTAGGAVWLDERRTSPWALYQVLVNSDDAVVGQYLRFLTFLGHERLSELDVLTQTVPERRDAQRALAQEVTAMVHGEVAARAAARAAEVLFGGPLEDLDEGTLLEVFGDAPSSQVARSRLEGGWDLLDALLESGLVASRGAARRAVAEGSVYVNGRRASEDTRALGRSDLLHDRYVVLRRGRRSQHLLRVDA